MITSSFLAFVSAALAVGLLASGWQKLMARDWRTKMSDKTAMEAAREAALQKAWTEYEDKERKTHPHLDVQGRPWFREFFTAGYDARQPKPCVWTIDSFVGLEHRYRVGCKGFVMDVIDFLYCPYCGGKIEESE